MYLYYAQLIRTIILFFFSFRTCFQKSCLNEQDIFKFDLLKRSTKSKTEELESCT